MAVKYKVSDKEVKQAAQVEALVAAELLQDFKQEMLKRFKQKKDVIENWQDLTVGNIAGLRGRLQTIADKNNWSKNNLLDMAVITMLLWNEEEGD